MFSLLLVATVILCIEATFIHPPPYTKNENRYQDNPRYNWGSTVLFQWVIDSPENVTLWLYMEYPKFGGSPILHDSWRGGSENIQPISMTNWTATLQGLESVLFPDGDDAVLFLKLADTETNEAQFYSSYFNVTVPRSRTASVATSAATLSLTLTPTTNFTTPTVLLTPSTDVLPSGEESTTGLSQEIVGGIAAGVTIGGILALGGLGFAFWSRRKKRDANKVPGPSQCPGPTYLDSEPPSQVKGNRAKAESTELDSGTVYEMP